MANTTVGALHPEIVPYSSSRHIVVYPVVSCLIIYFIYGIYILIFGLSLHVLLSRKGSSRPRFYLACTIVLFALATAYVGITTWSFLRQGVIEYDYIKEQDYIGLTGFLHHDSGRTFWIGSTGLINTVMNVIADGMLIHRCFVVWGSNRIVLYTLGSVSVIVNGLDLATTIVDTVALNNLGDPKMNATFNKSIVVNNGNSIAVAAFNLLLACLTGMSIRCDDIEVHLIAFDSQEDEFGI
ncbi:hypothetical protein V5O48_015153 [Marasmius crinis-equi]|uniref:Uncharacterized protein n=1 Tax=Marasmius crinis-equi TaxID=585013 RepID=A0ABR3EVB2_9AGAR